MRIFLSKPHMSGAEQTFVTEAFKSNYVAPLGPQLTEFEAVISRYLGGDIHCVGLSSGSAALHLALLIAGVGKGDDVWVCSMTFAGGIFPVSYLGAVPTFVDLSTDSWTIDCDLLEEELARAAKAGRLPTALVPTDLYGQSVDLDRLEDLAERYGFALIVDSAESLGASYKGGRKCGTGGQSAVLSFNGNKIITTSGGGMLVTRDRAIADKARFLSTQARDPAPHYEHSEVGFNYRLSNICAAIGLGQMTVLDNRVEARRHIFERYQTAFAGSGISFMPEPEGFRSTRWLTTIRVDPAKTGITREDIRLNLLQVDIESRPLWKPMHMQPVFAGASYLGGGVDEELFKQGLCLPSGSDMTETEQDEVIDRIQNLLKAA